MFRRAWRWILTVIDRNRGLAEFTRQMRGKRRVVIEVGLQDGDMNGNKSVAEYGMKNEFGTSRQPSRPFMRPAFDENIQKIRQQMNLQYQAVLSGASTLYQAVGIIGQYHVRDIQNKISDNVPPPNSPVTIALKGSDRTLIDTGIMRASVRYVMKAY